MILAGADLAPETSRVRETVRALDLIITADMAHIQDVIDDAVDDALQECDPKGPRSWVECLELIKRRVCSDIEEEIKFWQRQPHRRWR